MSTPSLLDWLNAKFGTPPIQRTLRFGLAAVLALNGGWKLYTQDPSGSGWLWLLLALGALVWALTVPFTAAPTATDPTAFPEISLKAQFDVKGSTLASLPQWLAVGRLFSVFVLAAIGQSILTYNRDAYVYGLAFYAGAIFMFVFSLWRDGLLGERHADLPLQEDTLLPRMRWLAVALGAGILAYVGASDNEFRVWGVLAWLISVGAWLAAFWATPLELTKGWQHLQTWWQAHWPNGQLQFSFTLSRTVVLFCLIFVLGAYFRFAQLDAIPLEMTSDHVEKLFDVNDVVNGRRPVFFERNTGREPLQFYFAYLIILLFNTGVTHLTLKLTGAIAGVLLLPTMYFLGRELEDERLGLLAMALTAISFWATAISRVGLRFPLDPVFAAPVLLFLLRGLRRGTRNDFLMAGLFLGAGLYGYSPIRIIPVAVILTVVWFALWHLFGPHLRALAVNLLLLFGTMFITFLPLYRYATTPDNMFWYRTFSRLGEEEQAIAEPVLKIFFENQWNVLRMFNWQGDEVWVNTIPLMPVLDFISGALLILGAVFLLARLVVRRDKVAGWLLLIVPVLLLPSSLAFAFPGENPSVVRAGGAIPIIFLIAAYPLWLVVKHLPRLNPDPRARLLSWLAPVGLIAVATLINQQLYFVRYPAQFLGPAQNASEIGAAVRGFANSVGSYENAWMCLHPHWADTRAVGIYAGQVGWENVKPAPDFITLQTVAANQLVVVNPRSTECMGTLRALFPAGHFNVVHSERGIDKDFLLFFIPGVNDVDPGALPAP